MDELAREMRMWRLEQAQRGARAPRLDGLEHVGWMYENNAADLDVRRVIGHVPKSRLDDLRAAGFLTRPVYAGPRHSGAEPQDAAEGVLALQQEQREARGLKWWPSDEDVAEVEQARAASAPTQKYGLSSTDGVEGSKP